MRFRVKSIKPGYCEVWANERDGGRYGLVANVKKVHDKDWYWSPSETPQLLLGPFTARATCIRDCKRTALMRLVEHAIEQQPKESPHWLSPRRYAMFDVNRSEVFTLEEREEIEKRLETFDE